jgi:two-component system, NtrC family, response regulator AtoC
MGALVTNALEKTAWNLTRAAKLLGLSRDTLRYRIEKFSLTAPSKS